jgi:hypothetical protein
LIVAQPLHGTLVQKLVVSTPLISLIEIVMPLVAGLVLGR